MHDALFQPLQMGALHAKNRIHMAPLTRGRAAEPMFTPNALMATYYRQRAGAGRAPCAARAEFWEQIWPAEVAPRPVFADELGADALWLANLAKQAAAVTVWHGDSASEQLLLARIAALLQGKKLPLADRVPVYPPPAALAAR